MRLYTTKKLKHGMTVKLSPYGLDLLSRQSEWTIRVLLEKLIGDLSRLCPNVTLDYDSEQALMGIVEKKPTKIFHGRAYRLSLYYIDGVVKSTLNAELEQMIEDIECMYCLLCGIDSA